LRTAADEKTLREIAAAGDGQSNPKPGECFAAPAGKSERLTDLTHYFLAAALVLLPFDIFLRRRTWRRSEGTRASPFVAGAR
jgi:hypothetical protein